MKQVYVVYKESWSTATIWGEPIDTRRVLKIFEDKIEAIKYVYAWYFANKKSTEHMILIPENSKILTRRDGSPEAHITRQDDDEMEYFMTSVFYVPENVN